MDWMQKYLSGDWAKALSDINRHFSNDGLWSVNNFTEAAIRHGSDEEKGGRLHSALLSCVALLVKMIRKLARMADGVTKRLTIVNHSDRRTTYQCA